MRVHTNLVFRTRRHVGRTYGRPIFATRLKALQETIVLAFRPPAFPFLQSGYREPKKERGQATDSRYMIQQELFSLHHGLKK